MDDADDTGGELASDAFDLLADETRVAILDALAGRLREAPDDPVVGFSDLRRRVGMRDSGNFNYHLEKLLGRFVRKTEAGYRISSAGMMVVGAAMAGAYEPGGKRGPTELDVPCGHCGKPMEAVYEETLVTVGCENDHVFQNVLPPGALDGRTLPEAVELMLLRTHQDLEMARKQGCPFCYGPLEWETAESPMADHVLVGRCQRCGVSAQAPVGAFVVRHPAVVALYHEHGIDVRERPLWTLSLCTDEAVSALDTEPPRYRVTVALEEGAVRLTLDDTATVLGVDRARDGSGPSGMT